MIELNMIGVIYQKMFGAQTILHQSLDLINMNMEVIVVIQILSLVTILLKPSHPLTR